MKIKIGNKEIGDGCPTFIIAEMSANHGGDIEKAFEIIRAAKAVGADAVKLQTYLPSTITLDTDNPDFQIPGDNPWSASKNLFQLYEKAYTPWEWHEALFNEARRIGIMIFSSPFDRTAVDLLEKLNTPAYKIASPEITDVPLMEYVGSKRKPVIVSTGVAEKPDIELAVKTLKEAGASEVILLKCTSSYPAPPESINLRTMVDMRTTFNVIVGLSDHTLGTAIPVAATALGAAVIEKHFLLEKDDKSVDSFFSLDQVEFKKMVEDVRIAELALGRVVYELDSEGKKNYWGRRSLYIAQDISKGEKANPENIRAVRPHFGLHPKHHKELMGQSAKRDLKKGERVKLEDFDL